MIPPYHLQFFNNFHQIAIKRFWTNSQKRITSNGIQSTSTEALVKDRLVHPLWFPHQREIKGGGRQRLAPEEKSARAAGRRPTSDISHWWPILQAAPNQPGSEPDKNTFRPLADVSLRWVAKSGSSSSEIKKKSVIHSGWKSLTIYLIEGVTVHIQRREIEVE